MEILVRLLRVGAVTVLCVVAFAALFELFNGIGFSLIHSIKGLREIGILGALWWGVVFRAPFYVLYGTVPLLLIFGITEWKSVRQWRAYLVIWLLAGLASVAFMIRKLNLEFAAAAAAAILAAAICSYIYWRLAGKTAGAWARTEPRAWATGRFKPLNYAAYAVLAFLAVQLAGYLWYGGKLFWVTAVHEPDRGTPPYRMPYSWKFTAFDKVAMMDFPDAPSCLKAEAAGPDRLKMMDWDLIDTVSEAEVCIFRLLGSYDNVSHAAPWLEAQGFSARDYTETDSRYPRNFPGRRISGSYSIRQNGPKFPTRGFIRRGFRSISYGMNVDTYWSEDGKSLTGVSIGFNTL